MSFIFFYDTLNKVCMYVCMYESENVCASMVSYLQGPLGGQYQRCLSVNVSPQCNGVFENSLLTH